MVISCFSRNSKLESHGLGLSQRSMNGWSSLNFWVGQPVTGSRSLLASKSCSLVACMAAISAILFTHRYTRSEREYLSAWLP